MKLPATLIGLFMSLTVFASDIAMLPGVDERIRELVDNGDVRAAVVGLYDRGETQVFGYGQLSSDDDSIPDGDTVFDISGSR